MLNLRRPAKWGYGVAACLTAAFLLVAITLYPAGAGAAAAEGGFNITTSPLPVELTVKPGGTVSTDLRVQNSGTSTVKIKVSLLKFKSSGTTGKPLLLKPQPGDTFLSWVSFSQDSFVAQPGVWNDIKMTIKTPASAAYGYYYAVVFSQDTSALPPATPDTGRLTGAAATLVLLNVQAAGEKPQLQITAFTASRKLYEYLPASFNITVRNRGNIHVAPSGDIFISRDHRHDIAVIKVNEAQGNILPNSNRVFQSSWDSGFPVFVTKRDHGQIISDKHGQPVQQLQWNFAHANSLRFGHYYAHLLLTYDNGSQDVPLEAEVAFWVIPWKILLAITLLAVILVLGFWSFGRSMLRLMKKRK